MSGKLSDVGFGKASCKWYASAQVDHVVLLDSWFSQAKVGPYDQLGSLIDRGRVHLIQGPFHGKPDTELYVKCHDQLDQTLRKVFEEVAAAPKWQANGLYYGIRHAETAPLDRGH